MPFIITLFIGLLLMGCGTEVPSIAKKTMPQPKSVTKPKLEGRYTLKKGIYSYSANSAINKNITTSDLVIEKLDNDDYGYYFTMQVENLIPTQEYGIFHKQGDKYFKRIIYSTNITKDSNISIDSNISDEHLQTEITDEVSIIQDKDTLKISMKIRDGKMVIIWTRDTDSTTLPADADIELKRAEHEYIKTYKERFNTFFKDS
jgi:hypothetical protein